LDWYGEENIITKCLKYGIGIHFGDLYDPVRKAIENDFRNNKLIFLSPQIPLDKG